MRREREEMLARQEQESTTDAAHVRGVQRENVQLNLKVKSLLTELEEIRSQREHVGMQADNITRLQVKQLAELSASVKALEVWISDHYTQWHTQDFIAEQIQQFRKNAGVGFWGGAPSPLPPS